jgi:hypothetical protein
LNPRALATNDIVTWYNYAEFTRERISEMLRWGESPRVGKEAPDFPLWHLDGTETRLSAFWSRHLYTVVEFGSFT